MTHRVIAAAAAVLFVASVQGAAAADTATLTVKVESVTAKGGSVIVAAYDAQTFSVRGTKPLAKVTVPAKTGETVATFQNLAPGTYGLKAMQDVNGDGHMHFVLGMPTEPYGFSNDPDSGMSMPSFDEVKIVVKPGVNSATVTLHSMM
jgi:uncharacterized protein (DUF2141 family)